ncbi:MAG TPA: hypothetical protein VKV26_22710 [Dehalococcoidia bacterium]|nr:hypothetical protein [Dehalococcoidia bacterium]
MFSQAYSYPVSPRQRGSTLTADAGDDRMESLSNLGGTVWAVADTTVTLPGDSTVRDRDRSRFVPVFPVFPVTPPRRHDDSNR